MQKEGHSADDIYKIREGDENAVAKMVQDHLPRIFNLCFRLTANREKAEDLSQETFINAIRSVARFRGESTISTWLYRIAVNAWKNRNRSQARRFSKMHISIFEGGKDGEDKEIDIASPDPSPLENLERNEGNFFIIQTLKKLEEEEKVIILLKDVDEKTYEEIAGIMNINIGTVKSRLSRARERFREIFKVLGVKQS